MTATRSGAGGTRRRSRAAFVALLAASCGGHGPSSPSTPSPPPTPTPTPVSVYPVAGVVFYDENGNGALDGQETVRLPAVTVRVGGSAAASGGDGRFDAPAVPSGTAATTLDAGSLPPFFQPGALPSVTVPAPDGFRLAVPVVLPIRGNRPNVYMAFGDSITLGDGSRGRRGYRAPLEGRLRAYWGRAEVANEGVEGSKSDEGADRIGASLANVQPAYTLIVYGTNDWNTFACRTVCFTTDAIRRMVREAKAAGSMPVVGTIIPANPAYVDRLADARNAWIVATNARIVPMAQEEGAVLADLHAAFEEEAAGDLPALFSDHVHPNDRGYDAIARELFRAITAPVASGSGS
jgi:lysophospholipase L1-like esterase